MTQPLRLLSTDLPPGFTGVAYSYRVQAVGGAPPYVFSATGLPASLSIDAATGVLSGTPASSDVGTANITLTVVDAASTTVSQAVTVTSRPSSYRRTSELVLDPGLEEIVSTLDVDAVSREKMVGHFSSVPEGLKADATYAEDSSAHWSSQILMGEPGDSVDGPNLDAHLASMLAVDTTVAEPTLIDVPLGSTGDVSITANPAVAVTKTLFAAGQGTGLLSGGHVILAPYTEGPVLDATDDNIGYTAIAQKLQVTSDSTITSVDIYLSREVASQTGAVVLTISRGGPSDIQVQAGGVAQQYGDGTQIIGYASIPVSSIAVGARTGWTSAHKVSVAITPTGAAVDLVAGQTYYLTVSSDYAGSSGQPIYVAASSNTQAVLQPGLPPVRITATPGTPNGPGIDSGPLTMPLPSSPDIVWAIGVDVHGTQLVSGATVTALIPDATGLGTHDQYWVGTNAMTSVRLVMGYSDPFGVPVSDDTQLGQLVTAAGDPILITAVKDYAGVVAGAGNTDSLGYLNTAGIRIEMSALPASPFKIFLGAKRRIRDLAQNALLLGTFDTPSADEARLLADAAAGRQEVGIADNVRISSPDGSYWRLSVDNTGAITGVPE